MTVFPDGSKERLHGHNFTIGVIIALSDLRFDRMIAFAPVKQAILQLCAEWKEATLLATKNPHFVVVKDSATEIEFRLCGQRYVLPRSDVRLLPIENIAVEDLAAHVSERLIPSLAQISEHIHSLDVTVTESPGQAGSCHRVLGA